MPPISLDQEYIKKLIKISKNAGDAIMDIYESEFDVNFKSDQSPLTKADIVSNKIICQSLKKITPDIPILSEESSDIPYEQRSKWNQYWLIDPLDGTKEFIKKNGEFTVNIALIERNRPIFGVIRVPAKSITYWGGVDIGSYSKKDGESSKKINVSKRRSTGLRVVSSRSHKNNRLDECLSNFDSIQDINIGSSLKFCLLAEGKADLYPRLGPTSEWDTAAGEAILKYSGGYLLTIDGKKMNYNNSEALLNPYFIASSDESYIQKFIEYY
tara:strand:+ start:693 stop:1502 length:810 start_codon:yes stop_codon:yes gene_type:complete